MGYYYLPMDTAAQGFQGNGCVGTFYTYDQYCEMPNKDLEEMERVADRMQDQMDNKDKEIDELGGAPQVSFGSPPRALEGLAWPHSPQLSSSGPASVT